jgi:hypothetical protein
VLREDPFGHLEKGLGAGKGWIAANLVSSLMNKRCPLCDVRDMHTKAYLDWLRVNLRDAHFCDSVIKYGGYCSLHTKAAIKALALEVFGTQKRTQKRIDGSSG